MKSHSSTYMTYNKLSELSTFMLFCRKSIAAFTKNVITFDNLLLGKK